MGVECEGENSWNYDTYSIAELGNSCKIVCRGQNGGKFVPKKSYYSTFMCKHPTRVDFLDPAKGFQQWLDIGLNSVSSNNWDRDYYYDGQTVCGWQVSDGLPGCEDTRGFWNETPDPPKRMVYGHEKRLTELKEEFNKCYKIVDTPTCDGMPGLTPYEQEQGQTTEGSLYSCTDGNNAGSVCVKSCAEGYVEQLGNPKFSCTCLGETCSWERTNDNFRQFWQGIDARIYNERSTSCIKGCNANPGTIWGKSEKNKIIVQCAEFEEELVWDEKDPKPVKLGNTCTVTCEDYDSTYHGPTYNRETPLYWMIEDWPQTGLNSYQMKCVLNQERTQTLTKLTNHVTH